VRNKIIPHEPDEFDHLDLDTYEGIRRKRSTKRMHRTNSSWSPTGNEETAEDANLKHQKRNTMDGSDVLLPASPSSMISQDRPSIAPSCFAPAPAEAVFAKMAAGEAPAKKTMGSAPAEGTKTCGEPSTEGISANRYGSSQSAATTLQGDMQGCRDKQKESVGTSSQMSPPMCKPMGPIMLVPRRLDWKPKPKEEERPLTAKPVDCSGCGESLLGSSAYACIFPTCPVLCCRRCACLLHLHWDDGGVGGHIQDLKTKLILEKGGPEAEALRAATAAEAEAAAVAARPKKGVATGAAIAKMLVARQREKLSFSDRWGPTRDYA